jgi:polysaccharide export outer membrane protein
MELWSRLAVGVFMTACLAGAQTAPAVSAPASAAENTANSAPSAAPPDAVRNGANPAGCPPGAAWFCVTQTLRRLMFNLNGTHKPDAEIAASVPRALAQMIQDGVMKPENAPKAPIQGFSDAEQFLDNYPSDVRLAPAAAANTPPAAAADCPKDRPWLCPVTGPAPAPASAKSKNAGVSKTPVQPPATPAAAPPPAAASVPEAQAVAEAPGEGAGESVPFYVYGPNDVLGVTVAGEPTVTGTYTIMPDGRMSMSLIGTFRAAGFTGPQLTDLITQKLRDDGGILEPIVNVQLLRSNSKSYTMLGAVLRPGPTPLIQETTVLDALSLAGFQEFANKSKITIRRGNKIFKFNFKDAVKGKNLDKNIRLEDGDYVYVPE